MREESVREFAEGRAEGQRRLLEAANLPMRRFLALDGDAYADGALSRKEKELLGLVASAVLRCDDCIRYHLQQAHAVGAARDEVVEALTVALVAGGSVIIPHLRRAVAFLEELENPRE
ncbi:MAG: carboxymuconolactone decarboxylase family protein [Candidatus Bipolaricaulis sp.]|nr:carboxymuconolactone decarboxylase family protein [Candidatus Bipolaricaulis sp.]MDD5646023.1 carboxymuconolactone decarboxylase family protein [Candidatus Bipolaricaulis sp.]